MEPESMVHALAQIHNLLKADGYLIDIHPDGELVEFFFALEGREQFIGYMQESDGYVEYHQADEAIEAVLRRGLFQVERMGEFEFRTYADSFDEMQAFLDKNWSDAVLTDEVIAIARKLEKDPGEHKMVLREQAKIRVLIAL